jgi:hypothetical protein
MCSRHSLFQNVAARPPKTLLMFHRIRRNISRARSPAFSTAHVAVARYIYDCTAPKISVPSLQLLQRVQEVRFIVDCLYAIASSTTQESYTEGSRFELPPVLQKDIAGLLDMSRLSCVGKEPRAAPLFYFWRDIVTRGMRFGVVYSRFEILKPGRLSLHRAFIRGSHLRSSVP